MGRCILCDVDRGTNHIPNPFDWDLVLPAVGIVSVARLYWSSARVAQSREEIKIQQSPDEHPS